MASDGRAGHRRGDPMDLAARVLAALVLPASSAPDRSVSADGARALPRSHECHPGRAAHADTHRRPLKRPDGLVPGRGPTPRIRTRALGAPAGTRSIASTTTRSPLV